MLQEQVSTLQSQISTLQNQNSLMHTLGNNLLKEKTVLKKHSLAFTNMIANLNDYIISFRTSSPSTKDVNAQPDVRFDPIALFPIANKRSLTHYSFLKTTQKLELRS